MKSKILAESKKSVFDVCKKVLKDFDCELISSQYEAGTIQAKRGGGLLTYGHRITVKLEEIKNGKIKISVTSTTVGIQLIDWGTNSDNENEILEEIANYLR
ncbi:MAG: hypothetical protein MUF75_12315 [Bacteroidia bacterium]|jgi:hypothetical protein|nr:hypothetical protein [Bacteroidia bacterium]